MNEFGYPHLRRTEQCLRALGYSERSIREITDASRREIIRFGVLRRFLSQENARTNRGGQGGGVTGML